VANCPELVEYYEALRNDGLTGGGRTLNGRALLMFKGMAAWMQGVSEVATHRLAPAAPRSELRRPEGIEQNLINIVATMTLATARRACHDG
jgi:hypothetical protein